MKNTLILFVTLIVIFVFAGCSDSNNNNNQNDEQDALDMVNETTNSTIQKEDVYKIEINVGECVINIEVPIEQLNQETKDIKVFNLNPVELDVDSICKNVLDNSKEIVEKKNNDMNAVTYTDGNNFVIQDYNDNGIRLTLSRNNTTNNKMSITEEQGWNLAKRFLLENSIMDENELDQVMVQASPLTAQQIDVNEEDADDNGQSYNTGFVYLLKRQVDSIPIHDTGDGVKVIMDENGINFVSKKWNDIFWANENVTIKSAQDILNSLETSLDDIYCADNITVTDINLIYFPQQSNQNETKLVPAWELIFDNGTFVLDACTGKLIYQ